MNWRLDSESADFPCAICCWARVLTSPFVASVPSLALSIMFIAANITPIDVVSHLPVMCEGLGIPYVYVPSKEELGIAGATKRPTSVILVQLKDKAAEHKELFEEVTAEIKKVAIHTE